VIGLVLFLIGELKMKWIDTTSYSHGEKDRTPMAWTIKSKSLAITVHRHRHYDPDIWLLSCPNICDCKELKSKDIELAKNEALSYIASYIGNLSSELYLIIEGYQK